MDKRILEAIKKHNLKPIEVMKEAAATFNEVKTWYEDGKLTDSFACDQLSAFFCSKWLQEKGAKVQEVKFEVPEDLGDPDAVGYVEFDAIKTATFGKRDIRFAEKWRSKMFASGYSWVETNQDGLVERYAHKYKFDVLKKVFWVSNIEK